MTDDDYDYECQDLENPLIKIQRENVLNDILIDEIVGEAKSIKSLEKVSIVFFDTDDRFKKLEFLID